MPSSATRSRLMCEVEPSKRCCKSWRKPLLMAKATIREATPAATPAIEIPVIMPIKAWRRLARKYRRAIKSSKRMKRFQRSAVSPDYGLYGACRGEQHRVGGNSADAPGQRRIAQDSLVFVRNGTLKAAIDERYGQPAFPSPRHHPGQGLARGG